MPRASNEACHVTVIFRSDVNDPLNRDAVGAYAPFDINAITPAQMAQRLNPERFRVGDEIHFVGDADLNPTSGVVAPAASSGVVVFGVSLQGNNGNPASQPFRHVFFIKTPATSGAWNNSGLLGNPAYQIPG